MMNGKYECYTGQKYKDLLLDERHLIIINISYYSNLGG